MKQAIAFILVLFSAGCEYSAPYVHDRCAFQAIDEHTFCIVMERESGTALHQVISPCPKTYCTPERKSFYKMTFDLANPPAPPRISPSIEMAYREVPSKWDDIAALVRDRLGLPGTRSLYARGEGSMFRWKDALGDEETEALQRMGFNLARQVVAADAPDGRWYLGFKPSEYGVELCCPARNLILRQNLEAGGDSLWDPRQHRLTVLPDLLHSTRLDIPEWIAVWDYEADQVKEYKLPDVKFEEVHLKPLAVMESDSARAARLSPTVSPVASH